MLQRKGLTNFLITKPEKEKGKGGGKGKPLFPYSLLHGSLIPSALRRRGKRKKRFLFIPLNGA